MSVLVFANSQEYLKASVRFSQCTSFYLFTHLYLQLCSCTFDIFKGGYGYRLGCTKRSVRTSFIRCVISVSAFISSSACHR